MIDAYTAFIDGLAMGPGEIRDEADLPALKQDLIEALIAAYRQATLSGTRAEIQRRVLLLAQFQPGVGAPILEPASEMGRRIGAAMAAGQRPDAAAIGRMVEADAERDRWALRRPAHVARVAQEAAGLLARLSGAR